MNGPVRFRGPAADAVRPASAKAGHHFGGSPIGLPSKVPETQLAMSSAMSSARSSATSPARSPATSPTASPARSRAAFPAGKRNCFPGYRGIKSSGIVHGDPPRPATDGPECVPADTAGGPAGGGGPAVGPRPAGRAGEPGGRHGQPVRLRHQPAHVRNSHRAEIRTGRATIPRTFQVLRRPIGPHRLGRHRNIVRDGLLGGFSLSVQKLEMRFSEMPIAAPPQRLEEVWKASRRASRARAIACRGPLRSMAWDGAFRLVASAPGGFVGRADSVGTATARATGVRRAVVRTAFSRTPVGRTAADQAAVDRTAADRTGVVRPPAMAVAGLIAVPVHDAPSAVSAPCPLRWRQVRRISR